MAREWELDDEIQEDIGRAVDRWENRRAVKPAPKRSRGAGASKTTYRASAPPNWQSRLQRLTRQVEVAAEQFVAPQASVKGQEIWYRLNASETAGRECLVIDFQQRERKLDGEFGKRKPLKLAGLMCRTTLSVDWLGNLYDCDFNQMLELGLAPGQPRNIRELDDVALAILLSRNRNRVRPQIEICSTVCRATCFCLRAGMSFGPLISQPSWSPKVAVV